MESWGIFPDSEARWGLQATLFPLAALEKASTCVRPTRLAAGHYHS